MGGYDDFDSLPSFDENPYTLQYLMFRGGTSIVELGGFDDDGLAFTTHLLALHVKGKQFIGGDEVDGEAKTVVMMDLLTAIEAHKNLGKSIADYERRFL